MPRETIQELVDLNALLPLIDAGFVLLTPNERLARRIRAAWDQHLASQGRKAWVPVNALPLERWLLSCWERAVQCGVTGDRVLLGPAQTLELWRQVIEGEGTTGGHLSLLQPGAAATMAHQARENLLRWRARPGSDGERSLFRLEDDCAAFLIWMDRFEQRLEDLQLATRTDCIVSLLACGDALPAARVALAGIDEMPPLFADCLQILCERIETETGRDPRADCTLTGYSDQRSELTAVARWARSLSRQEPAATIGIVLQDMASERPALEYLLRREFDCLGGRYHSLPVNFSTGITLDKAPVVRDAMRILGLGRGRAPIDAVVALRQSRFIDLPDAGSAAMVVFIERLFATGQDTLRLTDLQTLARLCRGPGGAELVISDYLVALARLRRGQRPAPPSTWMSQFGALLDIWGWPGPGALDTLEYQQVELWHQTLEEFAGCDEIVGVLSFDAALSLLKRCLAGQISQPRSDDSRIQVLGPLEAAGLVFDYLWLCTMQRSRWPAPPRPSPFIPMAVQRKLQLPHATAQREWEFSERLMSRYRQSAGVLSASYVRQIEGIPERASALVSDWAQQQCDEQVGIAPEWIEEFKARKTQHLEDDSAPPAVQGELKTGAGGSRLLEDQSQCPFRAFARHRLGAEPLVRAEPGTSAAERGSLLHQAMYELFSRIGDSAQLHRLGPAGREEQVDAAVTAALATLSVTGPRAVGAAWRALESRHLSGLLNEWLALEMQRPDFRVGHLEREVEVSLGPLGLRLRIDRIDTLPDGSLMIIDYKSGVCHLRDWLGDRPARPQMLLYSLAMPALPSAVCFAQVRRHDCAFVGAGVTEAAPGISTDIAGLVRNHPAITDWAGLNQSWRSRLQDLAREFSSGEARVDPQRDACKNCELQALCRIDLGGEAPG